MFANENALPTREYMLLGQLTPMLLANPNLINIVQSLQPNSVVHWVSNGDFSMHQLLLELINKYGAAHCYISSYACSEDSSRTLSQLLDAKLLLSLHVLVDNRIETRSANSLQLLKNIATTFKLAATHAKVTVLLTATASIVVVGSSNYTENNRYEAGVLMDDHLTASFHSKWIADAINN
jgi:hypothetical protein